MKKQRVEVNLVPISDDINRDTNEDVLFKPHIIVHSNNARTEDNKTTTEIEGNFVIDADSLSNLFLAYENYSKLRIWQRCVGSTREVSLMHSVDKINSVVENLNTLSDNLVNERFEETELYKEKLQDIEEREKKCRLETRKSDILFKVSTGLSIISITLWMIMYFCISN